MTLSFSCFNTSWGWIAVLGTEIGLHSVYLPKPTMQEALSSLSVKENLSQDDKTFREINKTLNRYFAGEKVYLNFPLDLTGYTPFQKSVLETAAKIPYGDLKSYGWIAKHIGKPKSSRAVGQALGSNRLPIIVPCHRIVRSDGSLGGFSAGLDWKVKLIKLEKDTRASS